MTRWRQFTGGMSKVRSTGKTSMLWTQSQLNLLRWPTNHLKVIIEVISASAGEAIQAGLAGRFWNILLDDLHIAQGRVADTSAEADKIPWGSDWLYAKTWSPTWFRSIPSRDAPPEPASLDPSFSWCHLSFSLPSSDLYRPVSKMLCGRKVILNVCLKWVDQRGICWTNSRFSSSSLLLASWSRAAEARASLSLSRWAACDSISAKFCFTFCAPKPPFLAPSCKWQFPRMQHHRGYKGWREAMEHGGTDPRFLGGSRLAGGNDRLTGGCFL